MSSSIDLCLGNKCNNNCLMCSNPDKIWPAWDGSFDYSLEAIVKRLEKLKNDISKIDSIYITGGEPTLHPYFLDILKYLKNNFPQKRIVLLTNARRFAYEDFARQVLNLIDNLNIEFSLYGHNESVHDSVTRAPGSFNQTLKGGINLLKLRGPKHEIGVRFVINGLSYKYVKETMMTIRDFLSRVDKVIFMFMEYEGGAIKNFDSIKIKYSQVRPYLKDLKKMMKEFNDFRLYHFPLCVLDKELWSYSWNTWPSDEIKYLDSCNNCAYKKYCVGIHKGYAKKIGLDEFRPIQYDQNITIRNNKFNPIKSIKLEK